MRMLLLLVCCAALSAQEMRHDVLALLNLGPNATTVSAEESKKLILDGPMEGKGNPRGIFVFDTDDLKKAQEWCDQDPAMKAGTPRVELHKWYSAKGIGIL